MIITEDITVLIDSSVRIGEIYMTLLPLGLRMKAHKCEVSNWVKG